MSGKSENLSIWLQPDIKAQVDRLAKANRRSRNFIINEAVGQYIAQQDDGVTAKPETATKKK